MMTILNLLDDYKVFGEKRLENGTYLIGKAPHIAPNAWLHSIYSGLDINELNDLEKILDKPIPKSYKSFLEKSNGLKIFNTTFCLYGLRRNYNRSIDNVWQPFDIRTPNITERPKNAANNFFFIGGYNWDGSLLYIDNHTDKVHLCHRDDANSIYEWNSFDNMLESEILRIITLFDGQGKKVNPHITTLPI